MTDTERRALELVNETTRAKNHAFSRNSSPLHEALCRAIERADAFAQEVSDAVEKALYQMRANQILQGQVSLTLKRFIIAKPDPLAEVCNEVGLPVYNPLRDWAGEFRAALAKRNARIVFDNPEDDGNE